MNGLLKHFVGFPSYVRIILMIYRGVFHYEWSLKTYCGFSLIRKNHLDDI